MAAHSIDSTQPKTSPYTHAYPKFAPGGPATDKAPMLDGVQPHPSTLPGTQLPTKGFTTPQEVLAPGNKGIAQTTAALVRQAEVLKKQMGAGRHALQYIAVGSSALGLTIACSGHPWAGIAVAAVGLLVGFGVQAFVRHRALKKVGANGVSGEQFKQAYETMLKEGAGVSNDPALESTRKIYEFLTRSMWQDAKHDIFEPSRRAAVGSLRLARNGLAKVFNAKAPAPSAATADDTENKVA